MGILDHLLFYWLCLHVIFATVFSDVWKAEVPKDVKALVRSCVVLPCRFQYPGAHVPDSRMRGIWHKQGGKENIYHEDSIEIADSFKGRTKLLGHLGDKNCTLEIDEVKNHDNGPFCFRAEISKNNQFSFVDSCVTLSMMMEPEKPVLDQAEILEDGVPTIFKCFIRHTCPSHPPSLTWSHSSSPPIVRNMHKDNGNWEVESLFTFTPTEKDDHTQINCTAHFHGGISSIATNRIYVKRKANIFHIIIPVIGVLGTTILFGGVCFFMSKKYKRQIEELQSRNGNGMLNHLSRMSRRIRSYRRNDRNEPRVHMDTKSNNCVSSSSESKGFSKPRFPSPKSEHKTYSKSQDTCSAGYDDDDYTNMVDMGIYGNV